MYKYITICPVIVVEISRAAKSDNAVLLLETVDMDQPAAVEFALLPSFCPGAGVVREQVFVARLRVTNRAVNEVSQCTVGEIRVFCPMGVLGVFI